MAEDLPKSCGYWKTLRALRLYTRSGVAKFIHRYNATGTTARRAGSGRSPVITEEVKEIVEDAMRRDDETSASQLHVLLVERGYTLSLRTILWCRTQLGAAVRTASSYAKRTKSGDWSGTEQRGERLCRRCVYRRV